MNQKLTYAIEQKILEFAAQGIEKENVGRMVGVGRRTVYKVLKRNRVPVESKTTKIKKIQNINNLISTRLLYHCDDFEVLAKRLAIELLHQRPEQIFIPVRLQKIIKKEKINKIISILDKVGLKCDMQYSKNAIAI